MPDTNARYYGAAASYNKPNGSGVKLRLFVVIGGIILLLILIFAAIQFIGFLSSGPRRELEQLVAREQSLRTFTSANQKTISSSDLAKTNAETSILLSSDINSLTTQMQQSFGIEAVSEEMLASETDLTSAPILKVADQNGRFDEEYHALLLSKIAATVQLAETVQQKSNEDLRIVLERSILNLKAVESQL
jgi:hypothetical protein